MPVPPNANIPEPIGPFECLSETLFYTTARKAQLGGDKTIANELGCTKKMPARHMARTFEKLVANGYLPGDIESGLRTEAILVLYLKTYGPGLWGGLAA